MSQILTPVTCSRHVHIAHCADFELHGDRTVVDGGEIEDVIWGCAFPEGEQGRNIDRVVGMLAGLPETTAGGRHGEPLVRLLQAVQIAGGMLAMNAGEAFIAGGTESMSRVSMIGFNMLPHPRYMSGIEMVHMMRKRQSRFAFDPAASLNEQLEAIAA